MNEALVLTSALDAPSADTALSMWSAGRDTADIARALGKPEALVANELPKFIERRREARRYLAATAGAA